LSSPTLTTGPYDSGEMPPEVQLPPSARPPAPRRGPQNPGPAQPADSTPPASTEASGQTSESAEPASPGRSWLAGIGSLFRGALPTLVSAVVHAAALIALAMVFVEPQAVTRVYEMVIAPYEEPPKPEENEVTVELEKQLAPVTERTTAVFSTSMEVGAVGASGPQGGITAPQMDKAILEQMATETIGIDGIIDDLLPTERLIAEVPDGQVGNARAVVDSYQEALDRITQELLWMLDKGPVLVVWAFDQSESMKDDQQEIRDRIEHVYKELGLVGPKNKGALETAVISFGENYIQHTRRPTADLDEIRSAINEVPIDPSGKEMTCSAVLSAIATHRGYAKQTRRQMALILVTDESGDRTDNDSNLERAIAEAKAARCKLYVLGREAVFGYPYAHIRWIHPQTKHHHWIAIDRGPETAFVEQLQTDGFHRRHDAHSSGAGPYEAARMARETSGIFFMLPSVESDLVHSDKRKYELEAMEAYLPDLRSRLEVAADRDKSKLRTMLTKVIYDLNPYNEKAAEIIEMRVHFSPSQPVLVQQARREQAKAIVYLDYLARAEQEVAKMAEARRHEASPRWQANYDLLYAQLVAYQARMYEYGAYLEEFIKEPKVVPSTKSPNLRHVRWDIRTRKKTITGDKVEPYIERATQMFRDVVADHPGTPWAARAEIELRRGFGVELVEVYDGPDPVIPPGTRLVPVPKL
jgi:hypothetical protein